MVEKGKAILSYIKHRDYRLVRNMAFEGTYKNYRFIAANMAQAGTDFFESLDNIANYDFYVSFTLNKRSQWNLSFRTTKDNVDVSEIASAFGGGGHKKASGASGLDELPEFLRTNVRSWTKLN
jgi:nanoRNase/pAp phosphatase (c-di-AMP/oligoRNAs hydrolase)